jgi:DNA-binding NtrC family response regulator
MGPSRENQANTLLEKKDGEMEHHTILYIFDQTNRSHSVLSAINETGWEVVNTNSATEGVALLYIMSSVTAVVLDSRAVEHAGFDLTESLRRIRPNVPVMLQCDDEAYISPSRTESCMNTDELPSTLKDLLTAEPVL